MTTEKRRQLLMPNNQMQKTGAKGANPALTDQPASDLERWPALDVDLSVESIRNPECLPLIAQ